MPGLSRSKKWPCTVIVPSPAISQSASTPASPITSSVPSPRLIEQFSNRLSISTARAGLELERGVAQHVAVAEVAARRGRGGSTGGAQAA